MKLHTYFNFDGDCRAAFEFYHRCLGGTITAMMTWKDGPMADQVSAEVQDRVMHACLDLNGHMLMGSDSTPQYPYQSVRSAHLMLDVPDPAEAERVFAELSRDGQVTMPMEETFWARRFGMAVDRFGVPWMVNCDKPAT